MKRSVLIVDADDRWAHPIAYEMSQLGLAPAIARSAREAFDLLSVGTQVSLMFTELRLIDYSGIDLMRLLKTHGIAMPTVLMSADATAAEYKRAIQEGAIEVLVKPFTREDLREAVRKAFDAASGSKSIIHRLNLVDLLQIMNLGSRSVRVKLSPGNGAIHMMRGAIVHAEAGHLTGIPALRMLLATEPGSIETGPAIDVPQTIDVPFQMLLLDLMREIDEARRGFPPQSEPSAPTVPIEQPMPSEEARLESVRKFGDITIGAGLLVALVLVLLLMGIGIVGKDLASPPRALEASRTGP